MEYARLELDATIKGWRCSECGLIVDSIGRPIFGNESWTIHTKSISWIENKPAFKFCPQCGKPIKEEIKYIEQAGDLFDSIRY